jgi:hypothetical protein
MTATPQPIKMIYTDDSGSLKVLGTGEVVLRLNSEKRTRRLGFLAKNENAVLSYYKHEKEKDVFRKTNAWSLNYNVLQYLPYDNSMINIKSEEYIYRITKEKALQVGEFMFFKSSGIEKKIYVQKIFFDTEGL